MNGKSKQEGLYYRREYGRAAYIMGRDKEAVIVLSFDKSD